MTYASSSLQCVADPYLLKQNWVLRDIGNLARKRVREMHAASKIPYVYDFRVLQEEW
jgi:hypothetical protein